MIDRMALRLSAGLLLAGELLYIVAGVFHPAREPANSHAAVFAEYAASDIWTAVHLGQFAATALILAGLLALLFALGARSGAPGWIAGFAAVTAVVAVSLTAALQAVDGVALKQAVDAWAAAPEPEKAARFASAESVRWLEWGVRSYQRIMLGLALLLAAVVLVQTARVPRPIGYLAGLDGLACVAQGWVVGQEGFSDAGSLPSLLALVSEVVWILWLGAVAWRAKPSVRVGSRPGFSPAAGSTG